MLEFITQLIPKAKVIVNKPDSIHYPQVWMNHLSDCMLHYEAVW